MTYTSTMAAPIRIEPPTGQPSMRWMISASANRLTPLISTVAIANVDALNTCAASPKRRRRYSGTDLTLAP